METGTSAPEEREITNVCLHRRKRGKKTKRKKKKKKKRKKTKKLAKETSGPRCWRFVGIINCFISALIRAWPIARLSKYERRNPHGDVRA